MFKTVWHNIFQGGSPSLASTQLLFKVKTPESPTHIIHIILNNNDDLYELSAFHTHRANMFAAECKHLLNIAPLFTSNL